MRKIFATTIFLFTFLIGLILLYYVIAPISFDVFPWWLGITLDQYGTRVVFGGQAVFFIIWASVFFGMLLGVVAAGWKDLEG